MNAESFAEYLKNPSKLYQVNYQELKSLALQYPYCQNLHWLLLQKSKMDGHKDADSNLEKTATLSMDRKMLYRKMKALGTTHQVDTNYQVVDEVLELPNLTQLRRPEPVLRAANSFESLEQKVTTAQPIENIPTKLNNREDDIFDISKLQVPPKPLDLPEIAPDPMPILPEAIEVPQPNEPLPPLATTPALEIPNPVDPEPILLDDEPQSAGFTPQGTTSIEWDFTSKQEALSTARARHYQPPVLQFKPAAQLVKSKEEKMAEIAAESVMEKEELGSETLAILLAKQGHTEKAIRMYEQLILKFPEKSYKFAAQIQKLKQS